MKLTVLIRAYNHEAYIAQAIESALAQQTEFDFEILVGDDKSADRTREIIRTYATRCPQRVRAFFPEHNIGRHRMLAEMIEACRGEYVAWLDGDDYWTRPDKLQKQADYLDAHPECSSCFHPVSVIYDDGRTASPRSHQPFNQDQFSLSEVVEKSFEIPTCSYVFRRGLIGTLPPWFFKLPMADLPFHVLIAEHGPVGFLQEVMGVYRLHAGGICSMGFDSGEQPAEQLRRRLEAAIEYYWTINRHFSRRFEKIIANKISMNYYDIVWAYQRERNTRMMRRYLLKAARLRMLNTHTPPSYVLKAWIYAFVPGVAALRRAFGS